ncbi:MAG: AraC family transcriptional regulator [Verrucomicrobiae bacterium]
MIAYRGPAPKWARDLQVTNSFFSFWFIDRGQAVVEWSGGRKIVGERQALIIPPGLRRHHQIAEGSRLVSLSFCAGWGDSRVLLRLEKPQVADGSAARQLRQAALRVIAAGGKHPPLIGTDEFSPAEWLRFHGELEVFVAAILTWSSLNGGLVSHSRTGDARLDAVWKDLTNNLHAGPLPFKRWADISGLSRVQLDRLARRWLGGSLHSRRDELLLEEVRRSLSSGRESLKELSARLGFFDAPHFTRWVKTRTGRNPSDLRGAWI